METASVNQNWIQVMITAGSVCGIMLMTFVVGSFTSRILNHFIKESEAQLHTSLREFLFLKHLLIAAIYILGISFSVNMIPSLRHLSFSVFAGSGILAVIIGFASQHSLANIVSGIFITVFKPFCVGDRVRLVGKEVTGMIEDITLRHTVIKNFENKRVIIPNSIISTEVIENSNFVDERICRFFEIGISYDSDMDKAMAIIREEAQKHASFIDWRSAEEKAENQPLVIVRVLGFGESSVNIRANIWAKDQPTAFQMHCDLNYSVKKRFDNEGIEIPYPHRTLVNKN